MNVRSWNCKGCTNTCYRLINGETATFCKPILEGRSRREWVTEDFIDCLDYTTDPAAEEKEVKIWSIN